MPKQDEKVAKNCQNGKKIYKKSSVCHKKDSKGQAYRVHFAHLGKTSPSNFSRKKRRANEEICSVQPQKNGLRTASTASKIEKDFKASAVTPS